MTASGYRQIGTAPAPDRLDLFLAAANRLGVPVNHIEKDFWVCWTLNAFYRERPAGGPRLLFKGGTSLSKAFGLIRFADTKTGPRTVHLSEDARAVIDRQGSGNCPFVFPSPSDPERPYGKDLALWPRVRDRAGLPGVRLHDLRHTYASQAVMRGIPLPVVARLLGHRQVRMTMRYAHVGDREVIAAAEWIGQAVSLALDGTD